ncbi:MAG: Clp protease N-terminal domain-containing protein [Planctomycetaceae bacterium]
MFAHTEELAKKNDQVPNLLHLLSAVLRNNGPAAIAVGEVLEHKELTLKELIRRCEAAATSADANSATEWTRVRNVAESTAKQWKHNTISEEHLLMALMVNGTTTNQFFRQQGIEAAAVSDLLYRTAFAPQGPLAPTR